MKKHKGLLIVAAAIVVAVGLLSVSKIRRSTPPSIQLAEVGTQATRESMAPASADARPASPVAVDLNNVPSSIRPVFGLNGEDFQRRLKVVKALGPSLGQDEREALYTYLRNPEVDSHPNQRGVVKNEVLNILQQQAPLPSELPSVLSGLFQDESADIVIRDYALQHLGALYEEAPDRDAIWQLLWQALEERKGSIAGTALLAIHRIVENKPQADLNPVRDAALTLANDRSASELARTSALQVCSQLHIHAALPTVLELVQGGANIVLQASALAALGELGQPQHETLIRELGTSNARLQPASRLALARLLQRSRQ